MNRLKKYIIAIWTIYLTFLFGCNSIGQKTIPKTIVKPLPEGLIELRGFVNYHNDISDAVEAIIEGHTLHICFIKNIDTVRIHLFEDSGAVVYDNKVDTSKEQNIYIPLVDMKGGLITLLGDGCSLVGSI
jgi:hypothetical protein